MRYVYLVGAPKTGKTQVAKKLAATLANSRIVDCPTKAQVKQLNYPLGNLADYRIETYLANMRALECMGNSPKNKDVEWLIVANSPLTNLAYAVSILENISTYTEPDEDEVEQWMVTVFYLIRLCKDTVWNDNFIFLAGNDGTEFGQQLEQNLKNALYEFSLEFNTVEGKVLQKYEKAAKMLA
jgi:nicotinamide riboside kinase